MRSTGRYHRRRIVLGFRQPCVAAMLVRRRSGWPPPSAPCAGRTLDSRFSLSPARRYLVECVDGRSRPLLVSGQFLRRARSSSLAGIAGRKKPGASPERKVWVRRRAKEGASRRRCNRRKRRASRAEKSRGPTPPATHNFFFFFQNRRQSGTAPSRTRLFYAGRRRRTDQQLHGELEIDPPSPRPSSSSCM